MTFQKAWGNHSGPGLSPASRERTENALARLETLLPKAEVRAAVQRFYDETNAVAQRAGLADPEQWLLGELPTEMRAAVTETLSQAQHRTDDEVIDEEVTTARSELVRYWVDSTLDAWTALRGHAQSLAVTTSFSLVRVSGRDQEWQAWDTRRRKDAESLLASIAVRSDDMNGLGGAFYRSLTTEIERSRAGVALPGGLELRKVGNDLVVEEARVGRVTREPSSRRSSHSSPQPSGNRRLGRGAGR